MKHTHITPLSRKLFPSFIISFLIPMALINCIVSYLFSTRQYKEISQQAENDLKLISVYMSKYMSDIDNTTKTPYYHSYFQSKPSFDFLSPYDQNQVSREIGQLLQLTIYSGGNFEDLLVLTDEYVLYFNSIDQYQYLSTVNLLNTREWYRKAIALEDRTSIVSSDDLASCNGFIYADSFYISRKLNNISQPEQTNIIMVNLKTDALETLFSSPISRVPPTIVFINEDEKLIHSGTDVNRDLVDPLASPRLTSNYKSWSHYSQPLDNHPFTVHVLLSSFCVTEQITASTIASLLCYILGVCIAYILLRKDNRWVKNPTYHIKSALRELKGGNLTARCQPISIRESNEIGSSVSTMAFRLREKIKNGYELTLSQGNLRFQALQSQIQPHFIINMICGFTTLNQIGEQEFLGNSFYSFARLLRYVLNKDNSTAIGKELDFLDDHYSLCSFRFGNRLSRDISCPESLRGLSLSRLLMQPLVESAVIYGTEPSEVPCCLDINITEHVGVVYIIIEDNGTNLTQEQLNFPDSIRIRNVEKRISIWNPQVRLHIYRIGGSTIQVMVIPE